MSNVEKGFNAILRAWNKNVSHSDIYQMILTWIQHYKHEINDTSSIDSILTRMSENEPTNEIVEDFIYGSIYETLRQQFKTQQHDNVYLLY
jgi:hypothetical protein